MHSTTLFICPSATHMHPTIPYMHLTTPYMCYTTQYMFPPLHTWYMCPATPYMQPTTPYMYQTTLYMSPTTHNCVPPPNHASHHDIHVSHHPIHSDGNRFDFHNRWSVYSKWLIIESKSVDQHCVYITFYSFTALKAPYPSKIGIFLQERFNKLIYSINTIIKCSIKQPVKFQLVSRFWTESKMKWFFIIYSN